MVEPKICIFCYEKITCYGIIFYLVNDLSSGSANRELFSDQIQISGMAKMPRRTCYGQNNLRVVCRGRWIPVRV